MSFAQLYADGKFHYSVEVFPPKTPEGLRELLVQLNELQQIKPAYISVTYGAMGSTQMVTKDVVLMIKRHIDTTVAFHFTCVGSNRESIKHYVDAMNANNISHVVALRGDIPDALKSSHPSPDGFAFANELVTYLKSLHPAFSIAVAGYPEKHVEAASMDADLQNLKRKVDAGADIIITQLFFDNQDFYRYVKQVRNLGIKIPIIPGVMPVQSLKQVEKISQMSGAKFPETLRASLAACSGDANQMKQVGIDYATRQCQDLIKNGAQGIHFYCLNKADAVLKIVSQC